MLPALIAAVDMGPAHPWPREADRPPADEIDDPTALAAEPLRAVTVDLGNPHLVLLVDDPAKVDVHRAGPHWEAGYDATWSWIVGFVSCAAVVLMLINGRRSERFKFPLRPVWAEGFIGAVICVVVLGAVWIANSYPRPAGIARQLCRGRRTSPSRKAGCSSGTVSRSRC